MTAASNVRETDVAVIGLSCRFPGAADATEFWENVVTGKESVSTFSAQDLAGDGIDPGLLSRPDFVPAGGVLGDVDMFDAAFFGYTPREAEILDPQQRLFLEHAWWAMEDAGYDVDRVDVPVGVFAGCAMSSYLPLVVQNPKLLESTGWFQVLISNDKDYLATRASYKLDLRGPSVVVQTACSTGLVAIHYAVRSIASGECSMAMAGASTVRLPEHAGHFHSPGGIYSRDGHCRPFDASADGTVFGNGVGVVVLKRLTDALRDGDCVRAVVKGGAINNDGHDKVGFTAPSLAGQTAVIEAAGRASEVSPDSVTYVETHGTGTYLGDPIEVEALTSAFRQGSRRTGYCALGAVKGSIGHLDPTAGVAGFIKTVLALEHATLPPVTNYVEANAEIDFASTPFFVNETARPWTASPRRAGVSAFGIGGTNAHVILEQAPEPASRPRSTGAQLLPLSGRTEAAVTRSAELLAAHLESHPDLDLADVAHTLQNGRRSFATRSTVTATTSAEAAAALRSSIRCGTAKDRPVVFLFPGQGSQHLGMAQGVLAEEPVFAAAFDECLRLVRANGGPDLAKVLRRKGTAGEAALAQTSATQPALFAVEYALATLWRSWGVEPAALLGHSVGEYVAATLAGVMDLEDAISIVTERGRLMQAQPTGSMLAVPIPEAELGPRLGPDLAVAAVNEPGSCIVAGPHEAIDDLAAGLEADGLATQKLRTSHAFHSPMMDDVLEPLRAVVADVRLREPVVPFVSNVSGTWITADEAQDPDYWTRQLRNAVRFSDGVRTLLESAPDGGVLLEVGPGQMLAGLSRRNPARRPTDFVVASLPHAQSRQPDHPALLSTLGRLWSEGVSVRWPGRGEDLRRVGLPGYPFERRRFWAVPRPAQADDLGHPKEADLDDWFYLPVWEEEAPPASATAEGSWVVSGTSGPVARGVLQRLLEDGREVKDLTTATQGSTAALRLDAPEGEVLRVVHLAMPTVDSDERGSNETWSDRFAREQERAYLTVVELAQALVRSRVHAQVQVLVVTSRTQRVLADDVLLPERAPIEAACLTVSQEYPNLRFRLLDVDPDEDATTLADGIVTETAGGAGTVVALRGARRLVRRYRGAAMPPLEGAQAGVRDGDVVLVTGGLGGVGLALAATLAQRARIHLLLLGRAGLPPPAEWPESGAATPLGRRVRALRAIEATGSTWEFVRANLADPVQTAGRIDEVVRRRGRIDVVLHAAGTVAPEAFFGVEEVDLARSTEVWRAKVHGLVALHSALAQSPPREWVLVSSLSSVLGGLGFTAYAAGNAFLDAYAERYDGSDGARWLSIDWDAWRLNGSDPGSGMTAAQGGEVLCRLLAGETPPRVVVSTTDLAHRLTRWVGDRAAESTLPVTTPAVQAEVRDASDVESAVRRIWEDLIGVEDAQPDDDFFVDLGGHSLLATQVASRLRALFDVEISLRQFLETPTLRGLSNAIWELRQDGAPRPDSSNGDAPAGIPHLARSAHRRQATSAGSTAQGIDPLEAP
jgi:phthiocerol/phenolphthiocerol synthesis type-I polyketide synthase E